MYSSVVSNRALDFYSFIRKNKEKTISYISLKSNIRLPYIYIYMDVYISDDILICELRKSRFKILPKKDAKQRELFSSYLFIFIPLSNRKLNDFLFFCSFFFQSRGIDDNELWHDLRQNRKRFIAIYVMIW